jgi:hypothetical protein
LEGIVFPIPTFQEAYANFAGIEIKGVNLIVWHVAKGAARFSEIVETGGTGLIAWPWSIGGERDKSRKGQQRQAEDPESFAQQ